MVVLVDHYIEKKIVNHWVEIVVVVAVVVNQECCLIRHDNESYLAEDHLVVHRDLSFEY